MPVTRINISEVISGKKIKNRLLWREIAKISLKLHQPAYIVGGAVRDQLRGLTVADSDFLILGNALNFAETARIHLSGSKVVSFPKFGSAFFFLEGAKLEFSAPRVSKPGFSEMETVSADLRGRDFTINAISVKLTEDEELTLFDPCNGIQDLEKRILRTPKNPLETFSEDPVRILRTFRFASRFKLFIEPVTLKALVDLSSGLERVAGERVGEELWKILELPRPSIPLKAMFDAGVLEKILPEVAALKGTDKRGYYSHKDIFLHSLKVLDNVAINGGDAVTRFATLLHDVAKPQTKRFDPKNGYTFHGHEDLGSRMVEFIGRRLRLPGDAIKLAQKLVLLHMRPINLAGTEVTDSAIRRLLRQAGDDIDRLLILCRADITSGNPQKVEVYLKNFDYMVQRMGEVTDKDRMRAFQSPVRGEEIMQICGIPPGPLVGRIKKAIKDAILDGLIPDEYDAAKDYFLAHKDEWLKNF
jgi:tRNA nucleotidyltransferase/poly(A) polymerase